MKRFLIGAIVAYALSATLLVAWWGAKASSLRFLIDAPSIRQAEQAQEPFVPKDLRTLFLDQGVETSGWQYLKVRFGDLSGTVFQAAIGVIFVICLVAAIPPKPGPSGQATRDPSSTTKRARRSALAASLIGFASIAVAWVYGRSTILHPYHQIVVGALLALLAAEAVALFLGFQQLAHGPRRAPVAGWLVVALAPLAFWVLVGAYGAKQWQGRNVPRSLLMQLSVAAGSALMRLESSYEYPHRLETDRLVMLYDVLDNPHQDGEAMDAHMAAMERTLGTTSGSKVLWVRGRLPVLGLGGLSVHEIALGSEESPNDWAADGRIDRHELAHAALDSLRSADADPPTFLHEGWAESQSGATRDELAAKALEQHTEEPSIGIVSLTEPKWYHHDAGPVYPLGGAFVEFLIRKHGADKFLRLYNESRESRFKHTFREIYDVELDAMESEFWNDAQDRDG
ncbi:hypothetical protein [Paludisphaera borealis]|uniref:Peptidase MA-like domain-containing protein n=1 Tax=Paludisphaera borealis TaxID=1387353 RepID=A0A1U7CRC4_9BACT|nr:hypothetical protein [Paludisphaera borealis]APW61482.1 hypothetical protein BSF38_02997 [Paludisphaera borealis]